jgi:hypothetical protein
MHPTCENRPNQEDRLASIDALADRLDAAHADLSRPNRGLAGGRVGGFEKP